MLPASHVSIATNSRDRLDSDGFSGKAINLVPPRLIFEMPLCVFARRRMALLSPGTPRGHSRLAPAVLQADRRLGESPPSRR